MIEKDPTLKTYFAQKALKADGHYSGDLDNWDGPKMQAALKSAIVELFPLGPMLTGDGTWPWTAKIEGEDIVVLGARATCFGGSNDPQDSGLTASGIKTKGNPGLVACSLPMDGRQFPKMNKAEHAALDGSPIPKLPWKTMVQITAKNSAGVLDTLIVPVVDLGPGKRTGNALDLTIAAARAFNPKATATNFELRCDFRIIGGAKYVIP